MSASTRAAGRLRRGLDLAPRRTRPARSRRLRVAAPSAESTATATGTELVRARITHTRNAPVTHRVAATSYLWLVDTATPPAPSLLGAIRPEDHFGGRAATIREAVDAFAAAQGERAGPGERVLMLTNARVLGHVFNPLTTYFCVTAQGRVRWVILEIHNTYGQRHAHLLPLDDRGRAEVDKEFYVSPFFAVAGHYRVTAALEPGRVAVTVALHQDGARVFSAALIGTRAPATRAALLRAAVRTPLVTHQVSARIRLHGIVLWLRRLPVIPRPPHRPPEGFR